MDMSAVECAYKFLASRMRTVREVELHLREKGFGREEVSEVITDLKGLGYIDDYQYALRYFEYNHEKRRGMLRAERELAEKGIDADTVRNAGEDYACSSGLDELADALEFARREIAMSADGYGGPEPGLSEEQNRDFAGSADGRDGWGSVSEWQEEAAARIDDRLRGRIARKLETRGYSRDIIYRVLEKLRS